MAATTEVKPSLIRGLGLFDATAIVVGSMIGSGIFIVPADIARQTGSPALFMATWVVTALMTLMAALTYGELAAAMPRAGGQYVYLREAYGPLSGFLYGWTLFLVIQTGTIAAVAVAFAKFTGVLLPWISETNFLLRAGALRISTQQLLAMGVLSLLTWVNLRGLRVGAAVQNLFTTTKVGALLALIVLGFMHRSPEAIVRNFDLFWAGRDWSWEAIRWIGVAMVGSLFSSDAWNNVTFAGEEVKNPHRNLPLALGLGVGIVSALYLLCNLAYLRLLPLEAIQAAPADRVGTAAVAVVLGPVAVQLMAIAIMISTFGCINGMILAGARVYYAMARDGLFFRRVAEIDPRWRTPAVSLKLQCAWACLLVLSGTYSDLLDYVIFAVLLFYILTIAGVFVLRYRRPQLPRPYRAIGYPVVPAIYLIAAILVDSILLVYKPNYTWPGLLIVLLGVPIYYLWRKKGLATG